MIPFKKDFFIVAIIGALIGILGQPIITNFNPGASFSLRVLVVLGFAVFAVISLGIAYLLGKIRVVFYQFTKFAAIGALNTFVDLGILNFEISLSGIATGWTFSAFKLISFLIASVNSFFWNKYWTFGSNAATSAVEVTKFYIVTVVGALINVGVASVVVNVFNRPESISVNLWANLGALLGTIVGLFWNFVGYKFLVFVKREK